MPQQISGTVTRKSNGTIEIRPSDAGTFGNLPDMGDEVTVDVEVTRTAADIEKAAADHKAAARVAPATVEPVAAAPIVNRRRNP